MVELQQGEGVRLRLGGGGGKNLAYMGNWCMLHSGGVTRVEFVINLRVLSERQKKLESILGSRKEILPYIGFLFLFILKLN